ncbi:MAG: hypothetical protein IPM23_25960 [Candidatus Melainabacteria bacterium]|nr:hypothetical protein [Candidatus Melainabacteria bacterium]
MNKRQRELENRELRYWKKLIEECRQGHESIKVFCQRNNVTIRKFYYWQRKVRERFPDLRTPAKKAPGVSAPLKVVEPSPLFLPLSVPPVQGSEPTPEHYRVDLRGGHTILVPLSISRDRLSDLVAVLESN